MRYVYGFFLLLFLGALGLFAVQNTQAITVKFWTWSYNGPVALLSLAAYFLGMISGWNVVGFVRSSYRQAMVEPEAKY